MMLSDVGAFARQRTISLLEGSSYGMLGWEVEREDLLKTIQNLQEDVDFYKAQLDKTIHILMFPDCPKCNTELDWIEGRQPSEWYCPHCGWENPWEDTSD
jgi:hypothetical protein